MNERKLTGRWGEALAADHLRRKGYTILAANYTSRFGEIDLIAQNRKYLVFVEVKLRRDNTFAAAREFVDRRKQERIRKTALLYLETTQNDRQPRFDVVEIYAPEGTATRKPQIIHLEDAFQ
jgi:putative endonuclease